MEHAGESRTSYQALKDSAQEEMIEKHPSASSSPRGKSRTKGRTDDWWIWELIGILVSAAAFIGLLGLLFRLDHKPQPDWTSHVGAVTVAISPNTLVALLSTLARLCLLVPIARSLAQLKWVWFAERPRILADLEVFEDASRGLMGSFALVWKLRFR